MFLEAAQRFEISSKSLKVLIDLKGLLISPLAFPSRYF